jgi:hypothetical protein
MSASFTQRQLIDQLSLSSGTISVRIDQLGRRGTDTETAGA